MGELICKNCVNTGIGLFNKYCTCKYGRDKLIYKFGFSEDDAPKILEFAHKFNYSFEDAVELIANVKNSFKVSRTL